MGTPTIAAVEPTYTQSTREDTFAMEACADHNFNATSADELSFVKGDTLKIINTEDSSWYKAESKGRYGFIPSNYITMRPHDWYHGPLKREGARAILEATGVPGAFLLRDSESSPGDFSLSVFHDDGVQHFKVLVEHSVGKYFLWVVKHNSINELIEYHKSKSLSRTEDIVLTSLVDKNTKQIEGAEKKVVGQRAKALYRFTRRDDQEISFQKDDELIVLSNPPEDQWWTGRIGNTTGLFPAVYVTLL